MAFNGAANLASSQGDYTTSRSLHEQSLALRREIGDQRGIAASLNNLGLIAHRLGDYPASLSFHEQSLAIKRELGDRWGMASSFNNLGLVAHQQGDFAQARSFYDQSLALHREHGDKERIAGLLTSLASGMPQLISDRRNRLVCSDGHRRPLGRRSPPLAGAATATGAFNGCLD